ncbi:unnamed protein product, partial [Adineta steineri]
MFADPYLQFNPYAQWNQWHHMNNTPFQNQPFPNQPSQQGWRGNPFGNLGNQPLQIQPYQMAYNQYPTHVQQAQYPMQLQQIPTQMNTHPPIQNPPLQLLPPQNTTRPTQLPIQPVANPNNKIVQAAYNVDLQTYPT